MRLTQNTPLIDGWVTLVGHDLMSDELVTTASQLARDNNTRITFHISPSSGDTASYLARTGKHPVRHLYGLGVLGSHVLLAHAVHLNDDGIDCIVETDTAVADNDGRYAIPACRCEIGVPSYLAIVMGMYVDPARCDQ
mgnify:CR=1 FL=1